MIWRLIYISWPCGILAAPQIWSVIGAWTIPLLIVWPFVALWAEYFLA